MSYTIEYTRQIFKMPEGTLVPAGYGKIEHRLHETDYFMFVKSGCNNLDPRPQTWHLAAWGWNYSIIQTVCERAGLTEGGCLKFQNGDSKPENYLKLYRKASAEAVDFTIENLLRLTGVYAGYLCLGTARSDDRYTLKMIEEIKQRFRDYGNYFDHHRYGISFKTLDDFRCFLHYAHIAEQTGGYIGVESSQNR